MYYFTVFGELSKYSKCLFFILLFILLFIYFYGFYLSTLLELYVIIVSVLTQSKSTIHNPMVILSTFMNIISIAQSK